MNSRAKKFGRAQDMIVPHPKTGRPYALGLAWDGSTKYVRSRMPTNKELKKLPFVTLTDEKECNAHEMGDSKAQIRRIGTPRCQVVARVCPARKKYCWNYKLMATWKTRLNYINAEQVRRTFDASTQYYPKVPKEQEQFPRTFPCTGAPISSSETKW